MKTVFEFWALAIPNVAGALILLYLLFDALSSTERRIECGIGFLVVAAAIRANVGVPIDRKEK